VVRGPQFEKRCCSRLGAKYGTQNAYKNLLTDQALSENLRMRAVRHFGGRVRECHCINAFRRFESNADVNLWNYVTK